MKKKETTIAKDTKTVYTVPQMTFANFIFRDSLNKKYLWIATGGMVVQLVIFKLLYPFADYFFDSYSYIQAAFDGVGFNFWPVGYSKYLYIFHLLTHSDTALVVFQYFFSGSALLLFFFTLLYWFKPSRIIANILFVFLFFNPLFLYLSNYIISDSLFMSLSVLWLTQLIWIILRPKPWHLLTHALLITMAFTIRYYAMYYPLITVVAFLLSSYTWRMKIAGIVLPVALIATFIFYTREKAREMTGIPQFSLASGWQWANNALYMYPYIQVDSTQLPAQTMALHRVVKNYFAAMPEQMKAITPRSQVFYIWDQEAPLRHYLREYSTQNNLYYSIRVAVPGYYRTIVPWGRVSPVFNMYGTHLAKQHPLAYTRYYLLPNVVNYFVPPLEGLKEYNQGMDELHDPVVREWFDYKSMRIYAASKTFQGGLLFFFIPFFGVLNICLMVISIWFFVVKGYKTITQDFRYVLLLVSTLFIIHMGFSILASPIVFRYQIFPMVIYFAFCLLLVERLEKMYNEQLQSKTQ